MRRGGEVRPLARLRAWRCTSSPMNSARRSRPTKTQQPAGGLRAGAVDARGERDPGARIVELQRAGAASRRSAGDGR